jgi:hypothetical protein
MHLAEEQKTIDSAGTSLKKVGSKTNVSPTKIPTRDMSLDSFSSDEESDAVRHEKHELQLIALVGPSEDEGDGCQ